MNIKIGDKVQVYKSHDRYPGEVGTVQSVYSFNGIEATVIVALENGYTGKFYIDELTEVEPEKVESSTPEGAREITKEDFHNALVEITKPMGDNFSNLGRLSAMLIGMVIEDDLFSDRDVITTNVDEFSAILWDGCNPVKQSQSLDSRLSVAQCLRVSRACIPILSRMVLILFPDVAENA